MNAVTDPELLAQLNGDSTPAGIKPVTDPALLEQLNGGGDKGHIEVTAMDATPDDYMSPAEALDKGLISGKQELHDAVGASNNLNTWDRIKSAATDAFTPEPGTPSIYGRESSMQDVKDLAAGVAKLAMGVGEGATLGLLSPQVEKANEALKQLGVTPSLADNRLLEIAGSFVGTAAPWGVLSKAMPVITGATNAVRAGRIINEATTGGAVGAAMAQNEGGDAAEGALVGSGLAGAVGGLHELPGTLKSADAWWNTNKEYHTNEARGLVVRDFDGLKSAGLSDEQAVRVMAGKQWYEDATQGETARFNPSARQAMRDERMSTEFGRKDAPSEADTVPVETPATVPAEPPAEASAPVETPPEPTIPASTAVEVPHTGVGDPEMDVDAAIAAANAEVQSVPVTSLRDRLAASMARRAPVLPEAPPADGGESVMRDLGIWRDPEAADQTAVAADIAQGQESVEALQKAAEAPSAPVPVPVPTEAPAPANQIDPNGSGPSPVTTVDTPAVQAPPPERQGVSSPTETPVAPATPGFLSREEVDHMTKDRNDTQNRINAAHALAESIGTPEALAAQDKFENGDMPIEAFEKALGGRPSPAPAAAPVAAPEYVRPSTVDTPAQGALNAARERKANLWKQITDMRQQIKGEPLNGDRAGMRLKLLKLQDAHATAKRAEVDARGAVEKQATRLGQTTVKPQTQEVQNAVRKDVDNSIYNASNGGVASTAGTTVLRPTQREQAQTRANEANNQGLKRQVRFNGDAEMIPQSAIDHMRAALSLRDKSSRKMSLDQETTAYREMEAKAAELKKSGWTNDQIGANAENLTVKSWKEQVEHGFISGRFGLPAETPAPSLAPAPPSTARAEAAAKVTAASRKVDRKNDDIAVAIAKLGGIDINEAQREWGDVVKDSRKDLANHVLKQTRRFGAVFKNGGKPLDKMRESLVGHGYLPEGADLHDLYQAVEDAAGGKPGISNEAAHDEDIEREAREHEANVIAGMSEEAKASANENLDLIESDDTISLPISSADTSFDFGFNLEGYDETGNETEGKGELAETSTQPKGEGDSTHKARSVTAETTDDAGGWKQERGVEGSTQRPTIGGVQKQGGKRQSTSDLMDGFTPEGPSLFSVASPEPTDPPGTLTPEAITRVQALISHSLPGGKVEFNVVPSIHYDGPGAADAFREHGVESGKIQGLQVSHRNITTGEVRSVITLAIDGATDATGYHEVLHASEALGLLSPQDVKLLERAYPDKDGVSSGERRADAFADYVENGTKPRGYAKVLFDRIRNFLARLKRFALGRGWRTADDVFGDVESGKAKDRLAVKREAEAGPRFSVSKDEPAAHWYDNAPMADRIAHGEALDAAGEAIENGDEAEASKWLDKADAIEARNLEPKAPEPPTEPKATAPNFTPRDDAPEPVDTSNMTSIKNAVTEEESGPQDRVPFTHDSLIEMGKEKLANDPSFDPRQKAIDIVNNPNAPVTVAEVSAMAVDRMRIHNEYDAMKAQRMEAVESKNHVAIAESRLAMTRLEDALAMNSQAMTYAGTTWSAIGHIRQAFIDQDYSAIWLASRAQAITGKKEIPEDLRKELEASADKIAKLEKALDEAITKAKEDAAARAIERIKTDDEKAPAARRRAKREVSKADNKKAFQSLGERLRSVLSPYKLNFGFDPEAVEILADMARLRIEDGITGAKEIVDDIYNELHGDYAVDKRDIQDALSGYGKTMEMSHAEVDVTFREVKRQLKLISALEDAEKGEMPLKSGLERDPQSDKVRLLREEVRQAMKASGIDNKSAVDPETQWKTSLDAAKTRLKNDIADLDRQIAAKKRDPVKKTGVKYDAEALKLQEIRNAKKEALDLIDSKPGVSAQRRIEITLDALGRSIEEYNRQIATGDFKAKPTVKSPETPEIKRLRDERDALHDQRDEKLALKREMEKKGMPDEDPQITALNKFMADTERQIKAQERALDKATEEYQRKIDEHDLTTAKKTSSTPELTGTAKKKAVLEALKETYKQMKKDAQPPKVPKTQEELDAIHLKGYKTRLMNREAAYAEKLRTGDFSKSARRTLPLDSEAEKLKARVEEQKQLVEYRMHQLDKANRGFLERNLDRMTMLHRGMILAGSKVLWKISMVSLVSRPLATTLDDAAGSFLKMIPGIDAIAEGAPRHGHGLSVRAEAAAYSNLFRAPMYQNMYQRFLQGKSDIELVYGKATNKYHLSQWGTTTEDHIEYILESGGRAHGAIKAIAYTQEFDRSVQHRFEHAIRQEQDISDPTWLFAMRTAAEADAQRAQSMQDNVVVSCYKSAIQTLKSKGSKDGVPTTGGLLAAAGAKVVMPIVKIPMNILAETVSYLPGGGAFQAGVILSNALRKAGNVTEAEKVLGETLFHKAVDMMSSDEKDNFMRSIKKQSAGLFVGALLGWAFYESFGGMYVKGEKRKSAELKPDEIKIDGVTLSGTWFHHPLFLEMQAIATVRRIMEKKAELEEKKAKKAKAKGVEYGKEDIGPMTGIMPAAAGLMEQAPFISAPLRAYTGMQSYDSAGKYASDLISSILIPQMAKEAAKSGDKYDGIIVPRKTNGVLDTIQSGIPTQREKLPVDMNKVKRMPLGDLATILENAPPELNHELLPVFKHRFFSAVARKDVDPEERVRFNAVIRGTP